MRAANGCPHCYNRGMYRGYIAVVFFLSVFCVLTSVSVISAAEDFGDIDLSANSECKELDIYAKKIDYTCKSPDKNAQGANCGIGLRCSGKKTIAAQSVVVTGHCVAVKDCKEETYTDATGQHEVAKPDGQASGTASKDGAGTKLDTSPSGSPKNSTPVVPSSGSTAAEVSKAFSSSPASAISNSTPVTPDMKQISWDNINNTWTEGAAPITNIPDFSKGGFSFGSGIAQDLVPSNPFSDVVPSQADVPNFSPADSSYISRAAGGDIPGFNQPSDTFTPQTPESPAPAAPDAPVAPSPAAAPALADPGTFSTGLTPFTQPQLPLYNPGPSTLTPTYDSGANTWGLPTTFPAATWQPTWQPPITIPDSAGFVDLPATPVQDTPVTQQTATDQVIEAQRILNQFATAPDQQPIPTTDLPQNATSPEETKPVLKDFGSATALTANSGTPPIWGLGGGEHWNWTSQGCTGVGCAVNIAGPDPVKWFWPDQGLVIAQEQARLDYAARNTVNDLTPATEPAPVVAALEAPTAQQTFTNQDPSQADEAALTANAQPTMGHVPTPTASAYGVCDIPGGCNKLEGDPTTYAKHPDANGKMTNEIYTIDGYADGKYPYVTVAGLKNQLGTTGSLSEITFKDPVTGEAKTLTDVPILYADLKAKPGMDVPVSIPESAYGNQKAINQILDTQPFSQQKIALYPSDLPAATPSAPQPAIQNLGSDASAQLTGGGADSRSQLSADIVPPAVNPRVAESATGPTVDSVRDINFAGLTGIHAVETGAPLPDITPLENRVPVPAWDPNQLTAEAGQQVTADVRNNASVQIDEAAQRDARAAQAETDAARVARDAQVAQDQAALMTQNDQTDAQIAKDAADAQLAKDQAALMAKNNQTELQLAKDAADAKTIPVSDASAPAQPEPAPAAAGGTWWQQAANEACNFITFGFGCSAAQAGSAGKTDAQVIAEAKAASGGSTQPPDAASGSASPAGVPVIPVATAPLSAPAAQPSATSQPSESDIRAQIAKSIPLSQYDTMTPASQQTARSIAEQSLQLSQPAVPSSGKTADILVAKVAPDQNIQTAPDASVRPADAPSTVPVPVIAESAKPIDQRNADTQAKQLVSALAAQCPAADSACAQRASNLLQTLAGGSVQNCPECAAYADVIKSGYNAENGIGRIPILNDPNVSAPTSVLSAADTVMNSATARRADLEVAVADYVKNGPSSGVQQIIANADQGVLSKAFSVIAEKGTEASAIARSQMPAENITAGDYVKTAGWGIAGFTASALGTGFSAVNQLAGISGVPGFTPGLTTQLKQTIDPTGTAVETAESIAMLAPLAGGTMNTFARGAGDLIWGTPSVGQITREAGSLMVPGSENITIRDSAGLSTIIPRAVTDAAAPAESAVTSAGSEAMNSVANGISAGVAGTPKVVSLAELPKSSFDAWPGEVSAVSADTAARVPTAVTSAAEASGGTPMGLFVGETYITNTPGGAAVLAAAKDMAAQGVDRATILKETGLFQSANGTWAQEISFDAKIMSPITNVPQPLGRVLPLPPDRWDRYMRPI